MNSKVLVPKNYSSNLSLKETAIAIKKIKDFFENKLATELNLTRVSAPLFVKSSTGLNDNLNGVERPVSFDMKALKDSKIEIIHSLAKWKRNALKEYKFNVGEGLYTDMNAIRRDEDLDNIHSIYVDQWDWEKIILESERTSDTLESIVKIIFSVFKETENYITSIYPIIEKKLPEEIFFITAEELYQKYPNLSAKEREHAICKEKKAVFIKSIGNLLSSGDKHDGRSPDYDDWNLNGDLLFYYPLLDQGLELSSMGIRVDSTSLLYQLKEANCLDRKNLPFHKDLLEGKLPYTIGGGIGQSRICMFFLNKAHIGEVQSSIWDDETVEICKENHIKLL
ncbi:aspartate--ammonia ligase [Clostridium massiliamazoniense]|uniref:aspartate--ammonia ligase n=1 Tax=Clostridium massiliamazoniense TaxID=1347366 RepID=UPI0006D83CA8|nr:aspartate--ammonia ligase [Clostridium massiliamazoniense]